MIGTRGEGEAVGVMAGLIPCPLALFVTTFAMSRGVPGAGVLFAVTMMAGVALTLSRGAVLSILFRQRLVGFIAGKPLKTISRTIEGAAGLALAGVAVWQIMAGVLGGNVNGANLNGNDLFKLFEPQTIWSARAYVG